MKEICTKKVGDKGNQVISALCDSSSQRLGWSLGIESRSKSQRDSETGIRLEGSIQGSNCCPLTVK